MPDPTLPTSCLRLFAHGPHETQVGRCEGVPARERTAQLAEHAAEVRAELHPARVDTTCPHPGCDHAAATPDRAHDLPVNLVAHLTTLGAAHGPALVLEATSLLWPDLAAQPARDAHQQGMAAASAALAAPADPLEGLTAWEDREGDDWVRDPAGRWYCGSAEGDHLTSADMLRIWGPRG